MAFSLYRVTADHVTPKGNVIGPGWTCQTLKEACDLMKELETGHRDLTNIQLTVRAYGGWN